MGFKYRGVYYDAERDAALGATHTFEEFAVVFRGDVSRFADALSLFDYLEGSSFLFLSAPTMTGLHAELRAYEALVHERSLLLETLGDLTTDSSTWTYRTKHSALAWRTSANATSLRWCPSRPLL